MKTLKLFAVALVAMCLASCGGSNAPVSESQTFDVTVDNTTIGGKLSQYCSLVDKTYKYKTGNFSDEISVDLKCKEPLPEGLQARLAVIVLDEDGNTIVAGDPSGYNSNDCASELQQATPDEIVTITLSSDEIENIEEEKPAKIRLTSYVAPEEEVSTVDSSDDASVSDDDTSMGSGDYDAMLDSYEEFINQYVDYVKKAANGDMSALAEYPALMEKAHEVGNQLESAKGEMSSAQLARYAKITAKMAKVAQ